MARLSGLPRHILEAACFSLFAGVILCGFAQAAEPLLLRNPSLSRTRSRFFTPMMCGRFRVRAVKRGD